MKPLLITALAAVLVLGCSEGTDPLKSGVQVSFATRAPVAAAPSPALAVSRASGAAAAGDTLRDGANTLVINQATPILTWTNPANIVHGTPLSDTQLNALADEPGTFAYNPAAGTVLNAGSHTLSVTFTPTDAANYTSASASVTLTVDRATPTVTVSGGSFPYDGSAHEATATATGVGGDPVSGTFTFTYNGLSTPPVDAGTYAVVFPVLRRFDRFPAEAPTSIEATAIDAQVES